MQYIVKKNNIQMYKCRNSLDFWGVRGGLEKSQIMALKSGSLFLQNRLNYRITLKGGKWQKNGFYGRLTRPLYTLYIVLAGGRKQTVENCGFTLDTSNLYHPTVFHTHPHRHHPSMYHLPIWLYPHMFYYNH